MTENKRFICYFDDILKKWCVQDTDSLDMYYVADEPMGEEFAHLLNLYQQRLDTVEKENWQLKKDIQEKEEVIEFYQRFCGKRWCGMTKKRYKLSEPNGAYLIDGGKPCAHWINDDDKIIDLLNDLVDENEQLKSELKKVIEVCRKYGIYKEELQYVLADYDKMLNETGERAIRYKYCANSR